MNRVAGRAGAGLLLVLVLVGGLGFFVAEYIVNASQWVLFPGSPHVYYAGNIGSGVVVDRENILLLNMTGRREYSSDTAIRKSTLHWIGDRNGSISAPALPNYSQQIAGFDLLNGLYRYGETTSVSTLTLSARVQAVALEAMGNRKGTIAVYNDQTGELLCAVTTPTYDPNDIPDLSADTEGVYEGMYLNRFLQSAYTPGSIFKIVTLAAALEEMPQVQEESFSCTGTYPLSGGKVTCETAHGKQSLKQAFANSCNCAFAQLSEKMGGQTLASYVEKFGVVAPVSFDGITTARGNFSAASTASDVAWSAIGQYTDLVNPCAFLTFMGAVAGGGTGAVPHVVASISDSGSRTYTAKPQTHVPDLSVETALLLQEYLRFTVQNKYGDANFPGMTVCAKTGTGELDKKASNAMFTGFVTDAQYPLAFIVCVEEGGYGRATCVPIASKVLAACKEVLDAQ